MGSNVADHHCRVTLNNGRVEVMNLDATNPVKINLGTWGHGVFRSVDGGETWSDFNAGLINLYISDLAVDPLNPNKMFAGTFGNGVHRSVDGGHNWHQALNGLGHTYVYSLAIDPQNPGTIYAGTNGGVYKSLDGAGTWVRVLSLVVLAHSIW